MPVREPGSAHASSAQQLVPARGGAQRNGKRRLSSPSARRLRSQGSGTSAREKRSLQRTRVRGQQAKRASARRSPSKQGRQPKRGPHVQPAQLRVLGQARPAGQQAERGQVAHPRVTSRRLFYFYIFQKYFLQKYIFNFTIYSFIPLPPGGGRPPSKRAAGTYM